MERRQALAALASCALSPLAQACARTRRDEGADTAHRIVLEHQPFGASPAFEQLLARFEAMHPGIEVVAQAMPSSSDLTHQFLLTALEGHARDFDVFVVDTVWVAELARAGWLADLSREVPPAALRRDFLAGPASAVVIEGRTFAVPWYADVGILFYRRDLVGEAPHTYDELSAAVERVRRDRPAMQGYSWQGRQYEGLMCNACEAIWGHGGDVMRNGRVVFDTPEARAAIAYLRSLIERGISPKSVASSAEEESRRAFQQSRVAFMRNWPYAWAEAEAAGSPIRGKVGIAHLPTLRGEPGYGTLGGYELAIRADIHPQKRALAVELVSYLTSVQANVALALAYGRTPARRAAFDDERIAREAPLVPRLLPMLERARPRPITPYYVAISDAVQGELSAAITGIRSSADALARAQALIDHITGQSGEAEL